MNRIVKFRVWDKLEKRMIYANNHISMNLNGNVYNLQNGAGGEDYELMQFTGLLDKNVKEIYVVNPSITNDFISVNFFGKLISKKFIENIHKKDLIFSNEIKQFNRNEKLKDLGI